MQKQLRIITRSHLSVCPFSRSFFPPPVSVSHLAFSRHARRLGVYCRPLPGIAVLPLPCGSFFLFFQWSPQLKEELFFKMFKNIF